MDSYETTKRLLEWFRLDSLALQAFRTLFKIQNKFELWHT